MDRSGSDGLQKVTRALGVTLALNEQDRNRIHYTTGMIDEALTLPALEQLFGLSREDAIKLALGLKLLSTVTVQEKYLQKTNKLRARQNNPSAYPPSPYYHPAYSAYPPPYPMMPYPYPPMYPPYAAPPGPESNKPPMDKKRESRHVGETRQSESTLYARNFPPNVTEPEVFAKFSEFGAIKEIRMQKDKESQEFSGSLFVEYTEAGAAVAARAEMDKRPWGDKIIYVDHAKERVTSVSSVSKRQGAPLEGPEQKRHRADDGEHQQDQES